MAETRKETMLTGQEQADAVVIGLLEALALSIREGRASVLSGTDVGVSMRDTDHGREFRGGGMLTVEVRRGPNWVEGHPFGSAADSFIGDE